MKNDVDLGKDKGTLILYLKDSKQKNGVVMAMRHYIP